MNNIIEIKGGSKSFSKKEVFKELDLTVGQGEFIAIIGESGCGKSTLLNIIGLLDRMDEGSFELYGNKSVKPFSKKAQNLLKYKIGYLFQNYALIENETVKYNLELVFDKRTNPSERKEIIKKALEKVSLPDMENKKIYQCSGGEQQRIALARLIIKPCELILADEPTGNLDQVNRDKVFQILQDMNNEGKTIVVVSHDKDIMKLCHKVYLMKDKKLSLLDNKEVIS